MARILTTALVNGISGTLAGTYFKSGGSRIIAATRTGRHRVNPSTPTAQKTNFLSLQTSWKTLTSAQQTAWRNFHTLSNARNPGDTQLHISGSAAYTSINMVALTYGLAQKSVPPIPPVFKSYFGTVTQIEISTAAFTVNRVTGAPNARYRLIMAATPSLSAGTYSNRRAFRFIQLTDTTNGTINIWSNYVAQFGTPKVGKKIFLSVRILDVLGYVLSPVQVSFAIVVA